MTDTDPQILITLRLGDVSRSMTVPGSTSFRQCAECDRRVLVGPASERRLTAGTLDWVICTRCASPDAIDHATLIEGLDP